MPQDRLARPDRLSAGAQTLDQEQARQELAEMPEDCDARVNGERPPQLKEEPEDEIPYGPKAHRKPPEDRHLDFLARGKKHVRA